MCHSLSPNFQLKLSRAFNHDLGETGRLDQTSSVLYPVLGWTSLPERMGFTSDGFVSPINDHMETRPGVSRGKHPVEASIYNSIGAKRVGSEPMLSIEQAFLSLFIYIFKAGGYLLNRC